MKRIDVLQGGQSVSLQTGFFGSHQHASLLKIGLEIPISSLTLRKSMFTNQGSTGTLSTSGNFTQLVRENQMIGYLIDRRGVYEPKVLDELFYGGRQSQ